MTPLLEQILVTVFVFGAVCYLLRAFSRTFRRRGNTVPGCGSCPKSSTHGATRRVDTP